MRDWPTLLDLFCKAGGTSVGYFQAGFRVTGVDHEPQKHYPFEFVQADALEYLAKYGHEYDVIAASPPCQAYTSLRHAHNKDYVDLVEETRSALLATGKPYVIENVEGAPLENPVLICGRQFGLRLFRHRLFESNVVLSAPSHREHDLSAPRTGRVPDKGQLWSIYGHFSGVQYGNLAMGIGWMNQAEAAEAIPPEYTRFIGNQLREALEI